MTRLLLLGVAFAAILATATAANLDIKLDDGAIAFGASLDTFLTRESNNTLKTGNLLADRMELTDRVTVGAGPRAELSPASLYVVGASPFAISQGSAGGIEINSVGNVKVQTVQFTPSGDLSGLANDALSIVDGGSTTNVTHTGAGDLYVDSVGGAVVVEGVALAGGSLTVGAGSGSAAVISGEGEVTVAAAAALTLTSTAAAIAHDAASGDLSVSSVNGDVVVEGITLSSGDITGVSALTASGAVTADSFSTGAGNVELAADGSIVSYSTNGLLFDNNNAGDTTISHTGGLGAGNLVIASGSNVLIETVVFNDGAVSAVKSVAISQKIEFGGTTAALTHTGASGNLAISSDNGNTLVEGVTFASSGASVTVGGTQPLLFPSTSAVTIEHTGNGLGGDLQITSSAGAVVVEGVTFHNDVIERVGGDLHVTVDGDLQVVADSVHINQKLFADDVITPDGSMSDLVLNKVHLHDLAMDIQLSSASGNPWFPWDILGAPDPWAVYHWIGGAPTVHDTDTCTLGASGSYWIEPLFTGIGQNGSYTLHVIDSTSAYFNYKGFTKLSNAAHSQVAAGFSAVNVYAAVTHFPDTRWRAIGMSGLVGSTPFSCYSNELS